jgi:hypothetical protein
VAHIPAVIAQLQPVIAKTARAGAQVRTAATGSRPPLNLDALDAARELAQLRDAITRHDLTVLARHEVILSLKANVEAAILRAHRILEPAPARVIVGPCTVAECPGEVLAAEGEPEGRCDTCGETYSVQAYRVGRVLEALGEDGTPVRAAEAARRLAAVGLGVKAKDVENWVRAGRLRPVDTLVEGKRAYSLYSLADVYDAARRTA